MLNKTGDRFHYYTYDTEPNRVDGKYHVGEGGPWGWTHKGAFKTAKSAKSWAVKKNHGKDEYHD